MRICCKACKDDEILIIQHYITRINEKCKFEKDELDPARVLFNFVKPPRLRYSKEKKFKIDLRGDAEKWMTE
ncbi:hypothetical protein NECAME_13514 [Necator americanus]|uniref:Uncharacterized protein n=1 Tax=Necator americanus TaxID=51031 RepID=W2SUQ8_NECAM|nr:hypothetical protein NECAME_13514 [Necator americanus]ETN73479.1 hypothetical protein NECAME_13514 [Necator americanus]